MCGIVGFIGKEQAAPILLDGLSRLEYRGYDSAGMAVWDTEKGLQVCDDTVEKIHRSEERMVKLLTPEEADTLVELLGKVYLAVSQPN